jgi:hypothetical protein
MSKAASVRAQLRNVFFGFAIDTAVVAKPPLDAQINIFKTSQPGQQ